MGRVAPDGYTLYSGYSSHVISGNLYKNLSYDAVKSFAPIALTTDATFTLVVLPSSKARGIRELVELAKTLPIRRCDPASPPASCACRPTRLVRS